VTSPAVDVVVPTRDRPQLLARALAAIAAQDYPAQVRVLVVVDRATADRSLERADGPRPVTVLDNVRSPGLAGARNTGLLASRAPLVAFCDDDDQWLPGKLAAQVAALHRYPDAPMAGCGIQVRYEDRLVVRTLGLRRFSLADLLADRVAELHPSTFLFRRALLLNTIGLVDEDLPGSYAEDYELLLRAARVAPLVTAAEVGVEVLWHRQSYFEARWAMIAEALTWLLERYPEFADRPAGRGRVRGQIAFAYAAQGRRREAARWSLRALRDDPVQPRALLAAAVATRVVSADQVLDRLHRAGRGI